MSDFTGYAKADSRKPFCSKAEFHRVNGTAAEKNMTIHNAFARSHQSTNSA